MAAAAKVTAVALALALGACSGGGGSPVGGTYEPPTSQATTTPSQSWPPTTEPPTTEPPTVVPTLTPTATVSPRSATYQVPDGQCPSNYGVGLRVTTDAPAELEYLDDIVACTTETGEVTYLKNDSDAVWSLRNRGRVAGRVTQWRQSLVAASFRDVFGPSRGLMVPGAVLTINLPPTSVAWDISLPLSISWEGHGVLTEKLAEAGQAAMVGALTRKTKAGGALAQCTLALHSYAETVDSLETADMSDVVLQGLGSGVATSRCREAGTRVGYVKRSTGRTVTLAHEIDRLAAQTVVLERVEKRLSFAARAGRVLTFGIRFLLPG